MSLLAASTRHVNKYFLIAVAAFILSGCTGSLLQSKVAVPTTYVLAAAPATANAETASLTMDLAISRPTASPGLDIERIALLHEGRRLDYYLDAQWGAALPQVVQSQLVGSLQNQKWFRSVTAEQARVNAAYLLDIDVRDFQAEYTNEDAAPVIHVTLTGALIRVKDRKLLAFLPAAATVNAGSNRLGAVVAAFEAASQQVALALGQQALTTIKSSAVE